jgi:hypothetical protein
MNFGTDLDNVYGEEYTSNYIPPEKPELVEDINVVEDKVPPPSLDPRPPPSSLPKISENDVNDRIDAMEKKINETIRKAKTDHNMGIISTLVARKRDALKLLSLSLMILLAISIHTFVDYVIKDYMMNSIVDPHKERTIRFMYPIFVFFIMWILKAMYL